MIRRLPRSARLALAVAMTATGLACTFHLEPDLEPSANASAPHTCAFPAVEATVVVVVPRNFREFVYSGSLDYRDISYAFGAAAQSPLRALLESCFRAARIEEVPEQRMAMMSVLTGFAGPGIDYVALARFTRVSMTASGTRIHVDVSLEVEFVSTLTSDSFVVDGDGSGATRLYLSGPLRAAGRDALQASLAALRANLEQWAGLLAPHPL